MLKRNKKMFSVILSLCMIISMFLGTSVSANAAGNVIESVTITNIPTIKVGDSIGDAKVTVEVPEGCIADSHWHVWNADATEFWGDWEHIHEGTFTETDIYYLCINFKALEGYTFAEDGLVVNYADDIEDGEVHGEYDENDVLTYHCDMPIVSFANPIYKIDITIPEVKAGNTAALENITFYSGDKVIANENFDIDAKWYCLTHDDEDVTGKTFEDGHAYQFVLDVTPKAGYYFADTLQAFCNDIEDDFAFATEPTYYSFTKDCSLLPALEKVELSGLPAVKTGETMVDSLDAITSLEDYDCDVYVYWWDENDDDTTGQAMEDGHVYTVQVEVNMYGNTPIAEDFVFVIDGIEYETTEVNTEYGQAWLELEYDLSGGASAGDSEDSEVPGDNDNVNVNKPEVDDTDSDNTPKTGDSSMIMLWTVLAVASIGAIVFVRKKMN